MVWGAVSWAEAQPRLVEKGLGLRAQSVPWARRAVTRQKQNGRLSDMSVPFHGAINEVSSLESMFIAFLFMGKQKFCPN